MSEYEEGDEAMPYIYLILSVLMNASSSVLGKAFNIKYGEQKGSGTVYNFFQLTSAFSCWTILFVFDLSFEFKVIGYSLLFSLCYAACNIGIINSLKYGPSTLTSLFVGLSLILTTIWGFMFWGDNISLSVITGMILVSISIYLCLRTGRQKVKSFSWKWLFYVLFAFFGNAGCSIVQRTQQVQYQGRYGNMMMFFATMFPALSCMVVYLKKAKSNVIKKSKHICAIPILAGVCNVILNILVMLMATTDLSPSFIYPSIGVGGLGVVVVFSLFVFKEKMSYRQWIGIATGVIAVLLLSV